jgi:hypothetical protein
MEFLKAATRLRSGEQDLDMRTSDTDRLLSDCRRLMSNRLRASMNTMLKNAEDTLFDMVLHKEGVGRAPRYINAIREMRLKKAEIQLRFENRFAALFEQQLQHLENPVLPAVDFSETTTTPEKAALGHAATKVRAECRTALSALDRQFNHLLEDMDDVAAVENPVQPEVILEAFWESCRDVDAEPDIRVLLVQLFEQHVVGELQSMYEDVSLYLQTHSLDTGDL